ncbi:MAG TPA: Plug domain-containing protein [Gemmatimonadaceae bacterium]|nr:Plug domain-containing protein [Gemmatimonadaceae bacterium]
MRAIGRRWLSSGLGLVLAGAVLHGPFRPLEAQVPVRPDTVKRRDTIRVPIPAHADSTLLDTLAKKDSLHPIDSLRPDTIKAPIAHAEMPAELGIGRRLYWTRDSLFATGAITLADLLARVPGLSVFHAGWVASPAIPAYMGDIRRVRVFIDGFEYTGLDPRNRGVLDLTQINLWGMEDAAIEQTAVEVRIYLRTWRVRNMHPETRTDVSTGDQQTNMYRGFYGKRLNHGEDMQFAAQQYGTTPPQLIAGGGEQTGIIGRIGWARPGLSIDGFISRISRSRNQTRQDPTLVPRDSIPALSSSRSDMYLRVGYADPDTSQVWWQAMLVGSKYDYSGVRTDTLIANPITAADSAFNNKSLDTSTFRTQYIVTGGTTRGPLRVSAVERLFASGGHTINAPSVRASFLTGRLAISGFAEARTSDSISHTDLSAQFAPVPFVMLLGSIGKANDARVRDSSFTSKYLRGEVGLRIRDLWFIGGLLRRDSVRLSPPTVYDTTFHNVNQPAVSGATAAIRGRIWGLIHADVQAVRWNDTLGYYRPRYQTRSELFVRTNWLDRFPSGNLGILASVTHEYRSNVRFPVDTTITTGTGTIRTIEPRTAIGYRTISTLLEIRILSATVSWQFRNVLGERYSEVPFFLMPRQTNFYGVRWSFVD